MHLQKKKQRKLLDQPSFWREREKSAQKQTVPAPYRSFLNRSCTLPSRCSVYHVLPRSELLFPAPATPQTGWTNLCALYVRISSDRHTTTATRLRSIIRLSCRRPPQTRLLDRSPGFARRRKVCTPAPSRPKGCSNNTIANLQGSRVPPVRQKRSRRSSPAGGGGGDHLPAVLKSLESKLSVNYYISGGRVTRAIYRSARGVVCLLSKPCASCDSVDLENHCPEGEGRGVVSQNWQ